MSRQQQRKGLHAVADHIRGTVIGWQLHDQAEERRKKYDYSVLTDDELCLCIALYKKARGAHALLDVENIVALSPLELLRIRGTDVDHDAPVLSHRLCNAERTELDRLMELARVTTQPLEE